MLFVLEPGSPGKISRRKWTLRQSIMTANTVWIRGRERGGGEAGERTPESQDGEGSGHSRREAP